MKLSLDTNVIIDLLADRKPYSNAAYIIFKKAKMNKWMLYTSTSSILTAFYILEKQLSSKKSNQAIKVIISRLEINDLSKDELVNALNSKTADLEDASEIECAIKIENINYIITRDKKGFKHSPINVLTPNELLCTV